MGAIRIPNVLPPKKDDIHRVDPFSDYSAAYMKYKTAQGQEFRRRKRDSDRWKRHQLTLEKERTHVSACKGRFIGDDNYIVRLNSEKSLL